MLWTELPAVPYPSLPLHPGPREAARLSPSDRKIHAPLRSLDCLLPSSSWPMHSPPLATIESPPKHHFLAESYFHCLTVIVNAAPPPQTARIAIRLSIVYPVESTYYFSLLSGLHFSSPQQPPSSLRPNISLHLTARCRPDLPSTQLLTGFPPSPHQHAQRPHTEVRSRASLWIWKQRVGFIKGVRMCHPKIGHFGPRLLCVKGL